jgi:RNA polymerase sigma-70 factor (ECF subfamily)
MGLDRDRADCPPATGGVEGPSFGEFIRRVRSGDERASVEFVRRYEPAIRRAIRLRLRDPRLRRLVESVDVCQSVFASFFVRAALGQYELEGPERLIGLLSVIARNKVARLANRECAGRRDHRRVDLGAVLDRKPDPGASPSRQVAARELVLEARRMMTPEERALLERRERGLQWAEIAAELGGRPDALRVRLARAAARVASRLGLDGGPCD